MRADRLVAVLMLLQRHDLVTAALVARELEVSERTARRDLEALALAGVPVYSQAGRGGGWRLVGGARTDLSGLNEAEARALFLVAGPAVTASPELRAALRKVVQALPATFRADAERLASSVVVDPHPWGHGAASGAASGEGGTPAVGAALGALQSAVAHGVQVDLDYADRSGSVTSRTVHPLGLVDKSSVWYLLAGTEAGQRTFRVDRVSAVRPLTGAAERPRGFDLDDAWGAARDEVDALRAPAVVELTALPDAAEAVGWIFGRQATVDPAPGGGSGDGQVRVTVRGHSAEHVAARLAGFGAGLEVVAPEEARAALARVGAELVERYGPPGGADPVQGTGTPSTRGFPSGDGARVGRSESAGW